MDGVEALRIAAARAKALFDFARHSTASPESQEQLMKDWVEAMGRYHAAKL